MKITIVYRYFWPDTPPYALLLREISSWLAEAGHDVRVLTAQPSYKSGVRIDRQAKRETINGAEIIRLPLVSENGSSARRLLNSALFLGQAMALIVFGRRSDVVWTATMPPVFQALGVMLAGKARGAKFIYHMQDIYPEIAIESGDIKPGLVSRVLEKLDNFTQRQAARTIVLSEDMQQSLERRGLDVGHVLRIQNFTLAQARGTRKKERASRKDVRFVFAGNIGRFQNLEALVDAFVSIDNPTYQLHFVGEGKAKQGLMKRALEAGADNIHFHDHMSVEDAFAFIRSSDVGLVSLSEGLYKYAFPSKVLTYMAADLPILAMVEEESELARLLHRESIGVAISWDRTSSEFARAIEAAAELALSGNASPMKAVEHYHPSRARDQWLALMTKLATEGRAQ